jgi:hypothetical protein
MGARVNRLILESFRNILPSAEIDSSQNLVRKSVTLKHVVGL